MPAHHSKPLSYTIYRLGLWYTLYRLVIVTGLLIIFQLVYEKLSVDFSQPHLYFYTLIGYCTVCSLQFIVFKFFPKFIHQQLIGLFVVDLIALSLLTFSLGTSNLNLSLLYLIAVFSASILLNRKTSLMITLIAVIAVVYQQFVGSLFDYNDLNNIGNSALLAFLFFVMYGIGRIAVQRFRLLENITFRQSVALTQLQNINRYILEQMEDGYLVLDQDYHVVLSNPAARMLLGIPTLFAQEQLPLAKVQPDLFELLRFDPLDDGEQFTFESQLSAYHMHIKVQHLTIAQQALILLRLQDVQQLNQQVQKLKLAALGQLSASIAHEIRNPLAAIVQANELYLGSHAEQQLLLQNMIRKQSQRINDIIEDTLRMARNDSTHPIRIELNSFLPHLITEDLADIQHLIQLQLSENISIQFDPKQLNQVLINLIRNAVRHNSASAEPVLIKVQLTHPKVWIDVIDYGNGVEKRDISQLFKPFFSTEIKGTGLGLYLSHSLCEANHAKLSYVEQEKGACFRIECSIKDK
ncbi:sensor histidine kinase [Acinetobacter ihumii]|uniref:sensor histidine kinase n=1 Tax=Acinetobacter ihumii TaxID=2483802 RepID=UPI001031BA47|nr:ATP-binding protein [Acinetobacter ihumii]